MLYQYYVKGFGPFTEGIDIDFTTRYDGMFENHTFKDLNKTKLHRITPIFGLNNTGKTQLINSIQCFKDVTLGFVEPEALKELVSKYGGDETITFQIKYSLEVNPGVVFHYLLKVHPKNNNIIDESFYYCKGNKTVDLLSKIRSEKNKNKITTDETQKTIVSTIQSDNTNDINDDFKTHVVNLNILLSHHLIIVTPDTYPIIYKEKNEDLCSFLKEFDPSIQSIEYKNCVEEYTFEKRNMYDHLRKRLMSDLDEKCGFITYDGEKEAIMCPFIIRGDLYQNPISKESEGFRRLYQLSGTVTNVACDLIMIVDELDRKIHPVATRRLIEDYLNKDEKCQQLIFTTHETSLISNEIFDVDEVFFIEKNDDKSTIHKASDLKNKIYLLQENDYLNGYYDIGGGL